MLANLIDSWINTNGYNHPPYEGMRDQLVGFLLATKDDVTSNQRKSWARALVSILDRKHKVSLVNDLLAMIKRYPDTTSKLIHVAMEIIYPPTIIGGVGTETKEENEKGNYEYVPYSHGYFAKAMVHWSHKICSKVNFIDVGCGIGDKVVLANWFVSRIETVTGVELNLHTHNLGKFFIGDLWTNDTFPVPFNLIHANAFDVDFQPYNLIYLFRPIADHEKMQNLYLHIIDTMPVRGIMIEVLPPRGELPDHVKKCKDFSMLENDHHLVIRKER